MAYCCVPNCTSQFKKGSGISFHEIPADAELRSKWMKVISRKNWQPNSISNYSRVCSKHFVDEDFKQYTKFKRLVKNAVPSIFPGYPSYLQPPCKKPRVSCASEKRNICAVNILEGRTVVSPIPLNISDPFIEESSTTDKCADKVVQVDFLKQETNKELNASKIRVKRYLAKLQDLQDKCDEARQELESYKNNRHIISYMKVMQAADENNNCASFLVDLVDNFEKKHPRYQENTIRQCLMWRACSTKGYEYARQNLSLTLPSRSTFSRYLGNVSTMNDVGVNPLISGRIKAEVEKFQASQEKMCSLIIDEMSVQQRLVYDKKNDKFIGEVDMGTVKIKNTSASELPQVPVLANHLLCFVACGLSTSYKIPVAYFFTKQLKGDELFEIVKNVIKEVELCGLTIVRLVTDNLSVNCTMFKHLSGGAIKPRVSHPIDLDRDIFLSFDYCHLIKNVRSQFLRHSFGQFLKDLYEIQYKENQNVKPVRFLTKKHIYPSNFEKMNVKRAVQVFSPPVTAALEVYKNEAGKIAPQSFANSSPAIDFMKIMYKWFLLHDVSNCVQHIRYANPDSRQYDSIEDERLHWLENTFLTYISKLQTEDTSPCMFTKETYEAIVLTTKSTLKCIEHLLTSCKFGFVLTRKFSSDPVEALFGALRQASGCHYQQDAASVSTALKKMLVTGIVASTNDGNVVDSSQSSSKIVSFCKPDLATSKAAVTPDASSHQDIFPSTAISVLNFLLHTKKNHIIPTTMLNISLALIAGYIVRVVEERINCNFCLELIESPRKCTPLLKLIFYQDRNGLRYPSHSLVSILCTLQRFAELSLPEITSSKKVLEKMTKTVMPYLLKCPALHCDNPVKEENHLNQICELIINKFLKPILSNFASNVTEHQQKSKKLKKKPLSRKVLTVNT